MSISATEYRLSTLNSTAKPKKMARPANIARLGRDALVNAGAILGHDTDLGEAAHVASGARLGGGVTVGDGAHVGTGAVVLQGRTIGTGAVVAAGAVVLEDVPDAGRVAGVPARPIRSGGPR